jgi:hypothetical protein
MTTTKENEINCLNLAMYMCARDLCGLPNSITDEETLMALQVDNGSWGVHPFYVVGRNKKQWFANQGLTTAFALCALRAQCIWWIDQSGAPKLKCWLTVNLGSQPATICQNISARFARVRLWSLLGSPYQASKENIHFATNIKHKKRNVAIYFLNS